MRGDENLVRGGKMALTYYDTQFVIYFLPRSIQVIEVILIVVNYHFHLTIQTMEGIDFLFTNDPLPLSA